MLLGVECPRSYAQMRAWFDGDWKCLDYLVMVALAGGVCLSALCERCGVGVGGFAVEVWRLRP